MDILPDWTRNISLGYVSGGGDVNHDGFSDFISCCNGSGYVDVYLGGEEPDTIPAYHWLNSTSTPAIIRDMNNDDFDDLCVARSGWGEVLWGGDAIDSIEDARLDFPCSGGPEPGGPDQIISAGDFNHDGYNDIVMLNNYCPDSWYGTLTLHLGSPWIYSNPTFVIYGWTEPLNLIHIKRAVGLGDVNGDGWDDFSVGANGTPEHDAYRGKAAVLRGDTSLHVAADEPFVPLPAKLEVSVYPNPFNNAALIELSLPAYTIAVDLTIFNLLGQEIFREEILPTSSKFVYHYDAGDLSTGLYLLRVNSGNLQTTTKLMVLK